MEKIIVEGGNKLRGEVNISLAKNSVLPIIIASILSPNDIVIKNAPMLEDVVVLIDLLSSMNCDIESNVNSDLKINTSNLENTNMNSELIRKMRASFLIMGPMLSRFGKCRISMPGGCNIGSRPIDLHLKGFKLLGAEVDMEHGYVEAKAKRLKGNRIYLDFPSVGATENILMAAVLAEGTTIIENAAEEPEIWDLANFLNSMGAKIHGAGVGKITIEGVESLKGITYKPIYDRVEAGTFMVAAAITNSKITINGANEEHLRPTIEKLKECGVIFENIKEDTILVDGTRIKAPVDIKTLPYPGFPTDMQSIFTGMLTTAKGTSMIIENIFENRYKYTSELKRMGAKITTEGKVAIIKGTKKLVGTTVEATDLRGGATLVLAGLVAKGQTTVNNVEHILRGYEALDRKLNKIGANVQVKK